MDYLKHTHIKFESSAEIKKMQEKMLRSHLKYVMEHSSAYQGKFKNLLLDPDTFTLADLKNLPFTEKREIENAQDDFLAVSRDKIADIVLSSGTTGKAISVAYTQNDLDRLAYNEEQSFLSCGISAQDVVLLTCTMDRCFIAGLAYFLGMRRLGASVIRNGHGLIESHLELIKTLKPTVIIGVPTFLKKLAVAFAQTDQIASASSVTKLICIGEPVRESSFEASGLGKELERLWNAKVFSTYASSETVTTFCECVSQRGGHLLPELGILEVVDEAGNAVAEGELGEIVMTPLAVEGMPLVRYKTGDISFVENRPCSCGRMTPRIGPILGRRNQRMKVKGTSIYPQSIFSVLEDLEEVQDYFVEVLSESDLSDHVKVHIALKDSVSEEFLQNKLAAHVRVKLEIVLTDIQTLKKRIFQRESRKPIRFFDFRKQVKMKIDSSDGRGNERDLPVRAEDWIPHSNKMCVIDTLTKVGENSAEAEVIFKKGSPFVSSDGSVDRCVYVEMIAQTIAAGNGFELTTKERESVEGFLLGVKDLKIYSTAKNGELLRIKARKFAEFGDFGIVEGRVFRGEDLIAEGEIKVFQKIDKEEPVLNA